MDGIGRDEAERRVEPRDQLDIFGRMALGADGGDIRNLVLGHGVRLVIAGVVIGLLTAAAFTRLVSAYVMLSTTADPLTFTVVTLLLTAIALWACYLPARRAMRVDPIVALRHE